METSTPINKICTLIKFFSFWRKLCIVTVASLLLLISPTVRAAYATERIVQLNIPGCAS